MAKLTPTGAAMTDVRDHADEGGGAPIAHGDAPGSPATHSERGLQDLLTASTSVVEELDLEVVLRRIVEAAMTLSDARYGALGVIGVDGGLERFIHVGLDAETTAAIGHLPTGRGVLGAVITDRAPIRLEHLGDDPRSVGFPAQHPAMESFLGVPIRVRDEVYGNLYLAESNTRSFSDEDQRLIVALAATAGIAIENARLYEQARTRELWNATIADVMSAMLDVSGENVLDVIAERVAAFIDADLVAVIVPHHDQMQLAAVSGAEATSLRGRTYPAEDSLASRAIAERRAVSIRGFSTRALDAWPDTGPTVAIPLITAGETLGVLTISRRPEAVDFSAAELDSAFAFAEQASIALEVVRSRELRRSQETAHDRARIARDLHDRVIQRLFGAGLALQSVASLTGGEPSAIIEAQIDAIDEAIKDIRTIIFALGSTRRPGRIGVRDRLLGVIGEVTGSWHVPPRISFAGPLDSLITSALADDLVSILRELLTNIVKHAHATRVQIEVSVADEHVTVVVEDDGVGISSPTTGHGLTNLEDRAALRSGRSTITRPSGGGTRVEWIVPLGSEDRS